MGNHRWYADTVLGSVSTEDQKLYTGIPQSEVLLESTAEAIKNREFRGLGIFGDVALVRRHLRYP